MTPRDLRAADKEQSAAIHQKKVVNKRPGVHRDWGTPLRVHKIKLIAARRSTYYQGAIIFYELRTNTSKETDLRTLKKTYIKLVKIYLNIDNICPSFFIFIDFYRNSVITAYVYTYRNYDMTIEKPCMKIC